ncbi:hypothetical protein FOZ60_014495, partial [Perkinsus olseni]
MLNFISTWLIAAQGLKAAMAEPIVGTFWHVAENFRMTFDFGKDSTSKFEMPGREPFFGKPFPLVGGPFTYTLDDEAVFEGELFHGVTLWYHGIRVLLPEADISPGDLRTLTHNSFTVISATFQGRELHFNRLTADLTLGVFQYKDPRDGRFEMTFNFYPNGHATAQFWCQGERGAQATFRLQPGYTGNVYYTRYDMSPEIILSSFLQLLVHLCGVEESGLDLRYVIFAQEDVLYVPFEGRMVALINEGKPLPA